MERQQCPKLKHVYIYVFFFLSEQSLSIGQAVRPFHNSAFYTVPSGRYRSAYFHERCHYLANAFRIHYTIVCFCDPFTFCDRLKSITGAWSFLEFHRLREDDVQWSYIRRAIVVLAIFRADSPGLNHRQANSTFYAARRKNIYFCSFIVYLPRMGRREFSKARVPLITQFAKPFYFNDGAVRRLESFARKYVDNPVISNTERLIARAYSIVNPSNLVRARRVLKSKTLLIFNGDRFLCHRSNWCATLYR